MRVNTMRQTIIAVGDTFDELAKDAETFWNKKHEGWVMVSLTGKDIGSGGSKRYQGEFEITYRRTEEA